MIEKPLRVATYSRVSSLKQERQGYSLELQPKRLREHAERLGHQVVAEFQERASASRFARRQRDDFGALIEGARRGEFDGVVLLEFERGLRGSRDAEDVLALIDSGLHLIFVQGDDFEGGRLDAEARYRFRVSLANAERESEKISERVRRGLAEKIAQGGWPHRAPLGYQTRRDGDRNSRARLAPDPDRAPLILRLFEEYASGDHSVSTLAELAARIGLTNPRTGRPLPRGTVGKLLGRAVYMGVGTTKDGQRYEGRWPPLVPKHLWYKVQEVRDRQRLRPPGTRRRVFRFGQLAHHTGCGGAIVGELKRNGAGREYRYYRCSRGAHGGCRLPYVREEALLEAVRESLEPLRVDPELEEMLRLMAEDLLESEQAHRTEARRFLQAQETALTEEISRAGVFLVRGVLSQDAYLELTGQAEEQRDRIRAQLAQADEKPEGLAKALGYVLELVKGLPDALERLTPEETRASLRYLMTAAEWDGETFRPAWHAEIGELAVRTARDAASLAAGAGFEARASDLLLGGRSHTRKTALQEAAPGLAVEGVSGCRQAESGLAQIIRLPIPDPVLLVVDKVRALAVAG